MPANPHGYQVFSTLCMEPCLRAIDQKKQPRGCSIERREVIALRQRALTASDRASLHWQLQMSPAKADSESFHFLEGTEKKKNMGPEMPHGDETIITPAVALSQPKTSE